MNSKKVALTLHQLPSELTAHHVRGLLGWDDAFSKALVGLPIESGGVRAFFPAMPTLRNPNDVNWPPEGMPLNYHRWRRRTMQWVASWIRAKPKRIAVFASNDHADNAGMVHTRTPYILVPESKTPREAVWLYLTGKGIDTDDVEVALNEGRAFTGLAVLTSLQEGPTEIESGRLLPSETLTALVLRVEHLVVEAFDDFQYLIWTPPRRSLAG